MESITTKVGIDAAKDNLDIQIERPGGRQRLRIVNKAVGFKKLNDMLEGERCIIAIEASGRYETAVRRSLEKAGHEVRLQNPRQVRRLAQGMGIDAKTDRLDAEVLVRTIGLCAPNEPKSEEREALADLERTISTIKKERVAHMNRLAVPGLSKEVVASLNRIVKALEKEIVSLSKELLKQIKASSLKAKYELALSIPGVGPVLAATAVCELAEDLDKWNSRQVASYANLAPKDNSSGKRISPSRLGKHGNMHLKGALYMPALNVLYRQKWAKDIYKRLIARGLKHQQAIVPIMRKLLLQIVSVLKRGTPWQGVPPKRA